MAKLYFILSIHNHQPVGNFDYVLEEAYARSYLPFLEKFAAHPKLKIVLHYSGNLLAWLVKKHPELINIIRALIKDGRAEILSGGFYEPILCSLPEKDRIMQIEEMTAYIQDNLGYTPKGMWLAERVWEPQMPGYISQAGIEYISVDDYHFKMSGLESQELLGYHITEDNGHSIKIFPGSENLRYLIPFKDVENVLSYFKEICMVGGAPLLTMADDGEKFGVWPETYAHCYDNGWLERFLGMLEENSDWIETTTFNEYQKKFYPAGRVYLPTASYREMGEWTLPPESALNYAYTLAEMEKLFGEKAKGFLRGGTWRSFFAKYPESNHIHKRMLQISRKVHEAAKGCSVRGVACKRKKSQKPARYTLNPERLMLHELWKGQCNDAYWHGIFGGLYLPHLRSSLYRHLLNAESMAEEITEKKGIRGKVAEYIEEGDFDCDGFNDICISTGDIVAHLSEENGALVELSVKSKQVNVLDVLTRRPEAYHSKIAKAAQHDDEGLTKTIHDRLVVKEEGLMNYLVYDGYRRASLLDHFFDYDINIEDIVRADYEERGEFIGYPYLMERIGKKGETGVRMSREGLASGNAVKIEKVLLFRKSGIRVDYMLEGKYDGLFGVEFNISFLGSPYTSIHAGSSSLFVKDMGMHRAIKDFFIKDEFLKLKMSFSFDKEIDLWHYPIQTISLSDKGVEKLYQGSSFLFMKNLELNDNKKMGFTVGFGGGK